MRNGIRSARKPQEHDSLSGVVLVYGEAGSGVAYVRFDEDFIRKVGMVLPRGVSQLDPAYLVVTYQTTKRKYAVHARYLAGGCGVLLGLFDELPSWVKVRKEKHAKNAKTHTHDTGPGRRGSARARARETCHARTAGGPSGGAGGRASGGE